jgi:hypothetical protein
MILLKGTRWKFLVHILKKSVNLQPALYSIENINYISKQRNSLNEEKGALACTKGHQQGVKTCYNMGYQRRGYREDKS